MTHSTGQLIRHAHNTVQALAGAVFEVAKPIETAPDDFKIVFNQPDVSYSTPASSNMPAPPATLNNGVTVFNETALQMTSITFAPCGVIGAHIHPRATEYGYVISGAVEFELFLEDASHVAVTYKAGEGFIIPQGTIHYVRNPTCNPSEVIAVFDSPNPATVFAGQALRSYSPDYLGAAFQNKFPSTDSGNLFFEHSCGCQ